MDIELLLANADDQRPTLDGGLPLESADAQPNPDAESGPQRFADFAADPNDLPLQRWGIVAPEGPLGDRLLALVEPLRRQREADQGAPVRVYRVPPTMDTTAAHRWKKLVYWDESVPEEELPRYLFLLGDLDQVPLELQQVLSTDLLVGRLACPSDNGFAAYVDKVLRWERAPSGGDPRALFFTAKDGTAATTIGHRALVAPSVERCRERQQKGAFHARQIDEIAYDGPQEARNALLDQLAARDPAMLFTMSHGLGAPRGGWKSVDEQRATQGAISVGGGMRITAEEVASVPFLPGGIWFFLACYGGGTPAESAYYHWLARLRDSGGFSGRVDGVLASLPKAGDRPFIAALPQAAIANPDGPLAIMAHIDLAWTYSFQDMGSDGQNRPSRFLGIFRSLCAGARAGTSYHQLLRFLSETSVELTAMYDDEARGETLGRPIPADAARVKNKANLWMLRQDLGGYILLGDPATRLPITRGAPKRASAAPPEIRTIHETRAQAVTSSPSSLAQAVTQPPSPPAPPREAPAAQVPFAEPAAAPGAKGRDAARMDAARMEEAVLAVLAGDEGEKVIAARHGVPRADLSRWVEVYRAAGRAALAGLA